MQHSSSVVNRNIYKLHQILHFQAAIMFETFHLNRQQAILIWNNSNLLIFRQILIFSDMLIQFFIFLSVISSFHLIAILINKYFLNKSLSKLIYLFIIFICLLLLYLFELFAFLLY